MVLVKRRQSFVGRLHRQNKKDDTLFCMIRTWKVRKMVSCNMPKYNA
jgi:hypothetical protein